MRIAEQGGDLPIGKTDQAGSIDDHHRIGRGVQDVAGNLLRSRLHWNLSLRSPPTGSIDRTHR